MNWIDLRARYFGDECNAVLGPLLAREGFAPAKPEFWETQVDFESSLCRLRFSHWVEDSPDYKLMTSLRPPDRDPEAFLEFPTWFLVPQTHPSRHSLYFRFRSAEELGRAARKAFDDILVPYAKPLWTDPKALVTTGERFREYNRKAGIR